MKVQLFSIYDSKVEAYLQPFFMQNSAQAQRSFSDLVNDKTHAFGKHPEDYTLFEIGSWEDSNCKFNLFETPRSLVVGHELVSN